MTPSLHEQQMAKDNIRDLLLRYSIPPIIGMLVNALYNVVDRFWVGRIPDIGRDALAGIGLCMPVMNTLLGFIITQFFRFNCSVRSMTTPSLSTSIVLVYVSLCRA